MTPFVRPISDFFGIDKQRTRTTKFFFIFFSRGREGKIKVCEEEGRGKHPLTPPPQFTTFRFSKNQIPPQKKA